MACRYGMMRVCWQLSPEERPAWDEVVDVCRAAGAAHEGEKKEIAPKHVEDEEETHI